MIFCLPPCKTGILAQLRGGVFATVLSPSMPLACVLCTTNSQNFPPLSSLCISLFSLVFCKLTFQGTDELVSKLNKNVSAPDRNVLQTGARGDEASPGITGNQEGIFACARQRKERSVPPELSASPRPSRAPLRPAALRGPPASSPLVPAGAGKAQGTGPLAEPAEQGSGRARRPDARLPRLFVRL